MTPRLTSGLTVAALIRRVQAAGGSAAVLAKGDEGAGAILVLTLDRGRDAKLWERGYDQTGRSALVQLAAGDDEAALTDHWQRRRVHDRDLWVIELDIPAGERFAAETIVGD